jgi:hypothetical protein
MPSPPSDIGVDQEMNTDFVVEPETNAVEIARGELGVVVPMCRPLVT